MANALNRCNSRKHYWTGVITEHFSLDPEDPDYESQLEVLAPKIESGPLTLRPDLPDDVLRAVYCGKDAGAGTIQESRGKCKIHFGGYQLGAAGSNFKHGRYSKVSTLALAIASRKTDPELTSLRPDIAAQRERLDELYNRLDTNEGQSAWDLLQLVRRDWDRAIGDEDWEKMGEARESFGNIIKMAQRDVEIWGEVRTIHESLRRLIDTETKRLATERDMMHKDVLRAIGIRLAGELIKVIEGRVAEIEMRRDLIGRMYTVFETSLLLEPGRDEE